MTIPHYVFGFNKLFALSKAKRLKFYPARYTVV